MVPIPQVMRERDDAAEFKARIEGLVHRYEAQHLPKRKRKLTTQQIRDMDEGARLLLQTIPTRCCQVRNRSQQVQHRLPPRAMA